MKRMKKTVKKNRQKKNRWKRSRSADAGFPLTHLDVRDMARKMGRELARSAYWVEKFTRKAVNNAALVIATDGKTAVVMDASAGAGGASNLLYDALCKNENLLYDVKAAVFAADMYCDAKNPAQKENK